MYLYDKELSRIIKDSRSLHESLCSTHSPQKKELRDSEIVETRLKHWCHLISEDDWDMFYKRISWNRTNIKTIRNILADNDSHIIDQHPYWAETLKEIIDSFLRFSSESNKIGFSQFENPIPFEDVLFPIILVYRNRLKIQNKRSGDVSLDLLSERAIIDLEHDFLINVFDIFHKTLFLEFSEFCSTNRDPMSLNDFNKTIIDSDQLYYQNFVHMFYGEYILRFFLSYPVLAKLIAIKLDMWVENSALFLERLSSDYFEIKKIFCISENLPNGTRNRINHLETGLSDPHKGGKTVTKVFFDAGEVLLYKPKDLGLDYSFFRFLEWFNSSSVSKNTLKIINILPKEGYGWVEFVNHEFCKNTSEFERFYYKCGMLLCLLYLFGATDCHFENLIACGEDPVLIDAETLFHPDAKLLDATLESTAVELLLNQRFWDSVLRTGLLPRWSFNKDEHTAYDISGLGSFSPQEAPIRNQKWTHINTDHMRVEYQTGIIRRRQNLPFPENEPISPIMFIDELVTGFEKMYRFLLVNKESLLLPRSILRIFHGKKTRFVFRFTRMYSQLLTRCCSPRYLKNGIDFGIELDILSKSFLFAKKKPKAWPLLHAEVDALEKLDIPFFGTNTNSDDLLTGINKPISSYFTKNSYDQVRDRLNSFSELDLNRQILIIKGTFAARTPRQVGKEPINNKIGSSALLSQKPLPREEYISEAILLASEIEKNAIIGEDGSTNWIGLKYHPKTGRFQFQPLEVDFYNGQCGVSLFLAALYRIENEQKYKELALGSLKTVERLINNDNKDFKKIIAKVIGIGGAMGLGSVIYTLVNISNFLSEGNIIELANRVSELIDNEIISLDDQLDVVSGSAGTILGLLKLYESTKEPFLLEKAKFCGMNLLNKRIYFNNNRAWKGLGKIPLTGFAHGAAGIAYSLLKLYEITKDSEFYDAAIEGVNYENSHFSIENVNWPDFYRIETRQGEAPGFSVRWCNGAPGIGLARLGGLRICEIPNSVIDIKNALLTTQIHSPQGVDYLCCGNMGRVEIMNVAGTLLGVREFTDYSHLLTSFVLNRARRNGKYELISEISEPVFNPSFFKGTAGIGYQLLRLSYPDILPSVLLWD